MSESTHPGGSSQALDALQRLDAELQDVGAADAVDPCEAYRRIRPVLAAALPIIKALAPTAGKAIEKLMAILDQLCKARG